MRRFSQRSSAGLLPAVAGASFPRSWTLDHYADRVVDMLESETMSFAIMTFTITGGN